MRIEKAAASKAKLSELVKQLDAEIAAIDGGNAEATSIRQSENAEYTKTSAEYKQATPGSRASAVPQYEWISWRTRLQAMRRNDHEMRGWLQH